jgi:hypothetical protein
MPIFKSFNLDTDIVRGNPSTVTVGLWSGNTGSLNLFFTGSQGASSSLTAQYYTNVYNLDPSISSSAAVQFALAYGHRLGGGNTSLVVNNNSTLSTQATYLQYAKLILDPGVPQFVFLGSYPSDHIYVVNIQRQQLRERLDPGNWQLTLSGSSGSFTFIDDSGQTFGPTTGRPGQIFNIVSGALSGSSGSVISNTTSSANGGFGLFYPSVGFLILNPTAISNTVGFVSGSYYVSGTVPFAPNSGAVQTEFNQVGLLNAIKLGAFFRARSAQTISSTHYFVTLAPAEFNYSNNPSFFNATNGTILNTDFVQNPVVYVTTVGLYNDGSELLAVGKLSKPIQKSFTKLLSVTVRLDW